jgi:hypothetical protein
MSTENKTIQWRVRPGLLLFFISVLALALFYKAGLAELLAAAPATARQALLLSATIAAALGWLLLWKDFRTFRSCQRWITLAAAMVLSLSISAYALYAVVPLKFIFPFRLVSAVAKSLWGWQDVLASLAWIVPFFGRGRSRIALVVGGTLMLLLWAAT